MTVTIPLFPLNAVLFPGGVLPLRVFEPRYLDMVSDSLRNETSIGVVLIKDGHETGQAPNTFNVGTLSTISYWNRRPDGLLGITLRGTQRFHITAQTVRPNQLILAEIEPLQNITAITVPPEFRSLSDLLRKIMTQLEPPYCTIQAYYDDLEWVSARLCELLPLPLPLKQELLMSDDTLHRIECLHASMQQVETV